MKKEKFQHHSMWKNIISIRITAEEALTMTKMEKQKY